MALFTADCDSTDILTVTYRESGRCHYVGKICIDHVLGACLRKAKVYCCFNSKLARIIHEQGRCQLSSFASACARDDPQEKGWCTCGKCPKCPACRGFTPEEFQAIDFGQIDFSEYIQDIMENVRQNIQPQLQERFQQQFQQFFSQ